MSGGPARDTAALARRFTAALARAGFDFYAGVPCSLLGRVWEHLERMPPDRYVPAVREDSAVGLAAGAYLGGRRPCVLMQNSGLGVCMNALASLHLIYDIPVLIVTTWRGEGGTAGVPEGSTSKAGFVDAPEHWVMGDITRGYFELLGIPAVLLDPERIDAQVAEAAAALERTRRPVALIARKGMFDAGH